MKERNPEKELEYPWLEEVLTRAAEDPEYQHWAGKAARLEPLYRHIWSSLTPEQRQVLDRYIMLQHAMDEEHTRVAYEVGFSRGCRQTGNQTK